MRRIKKIKSLGYLVWYSKHEFTHILLGLLFAWLVREIWQTMSVKYMLLSAFAAVLPDFDHIAYIFLYGRKEPFSLNIRKLLRVGQIRTLFMFVRDNHKHVNNLATHNLYFLGFFAFLGLVAYQFDSLSGVIIFGNVVIHLTFDIVDDFWVLGRLNDNWKRLRRIKSNI